MFSTTLVVATTGSVDSPPNGPAIDVFYNFGGGRYRTHRQHPLGAPPSMFATTLVVATTKSTSSTPRGPPSTSPLTLVVAAAGPTGSTP
jgi:hypothetical protein